MVLDDIINASKLEGIDQDEIVRRVQEKYLSFLEEGNLYLITSLKDVTGIAPELPEEVVQEKYAECIDDRKERYYSDVEYANRPAPKHRFGGSRPKIDEIEKKTEKYLKDELDMLKNVTGITISKDVVVEKLDSYLKNGKYGFFDILKKVTGIKPSEDLVQTFYEEFIKNGKFNKLSHIRDLTGIEISEDNKQLVQQKYLEELTSDNVVYMKDNYEHISDATGVKISEDVVQKAYLHKIEEGYKLHEIKDIMEVTGIKPSEETIQKGYVILAEKPYASNFEDLMEITGTKPPEQLVQKSYDILAKGQKFNELKELMEVTGIKPSGEVYKTLVKNL